VELKDILCRLKPNFNAVRLCEKMIFFINLQSIKNGFPIKHKKFFYSLYNYQNFLFSESLTALKLGLRRNEMSFNSTNDLEVSFGGVGGNNQG